MNGPNEFERQILINQAAIMGGIAALLVSQRSSEGQSLFLGNTAVDELAEACTMTEKLLQPEQIKKKGAKNK
jgi:hypothetical protein